MRFLTEERDHRVSYSTDTGGHLTGVNMEMGVTLTRNLNLVSTLGTTRAEHPLLVCKGILFGGRGRLHSSVVFVQSIILKISTPCMVAGIHFFLFQLNSYNTLYICIYITNYLLHVSVFVTPSSGIPLRFLLKNCMFFAMLLHRLCYEK